MSAYGLSNALDHMLEAARQAQEFVEGMLKDDFVSDKRTQQAVILNLIIIGEAATKLLANYPDFLERHPHIPWSSMKGMRNRIAIMTSVLIPYGKQ